MKPYISQPKGSMSCGAYTIAYYLWQTGKSESINNRSFVDNIYQKIKFGKNNITINEGCCNPKKMIEELNDEWHVSCHPCMSSNSSLIGLAKGLNITAVNDDILSKIKSDSNKYAIIICHSGKSPLAFHYLLIKYEQDSFKMLNSSAFYGNGTDNVIWEDFNIKSDNSLQSKSNAPYIYTRAGILID